MGSHNGGGNIIVGGRTAQVCFFSLLGACRGIHPMFNDSSVWAERQSFEYFQNGCYVVVGCCCHPICCLRRNVSLDTLL